ncbi:tRNA (adenosine(37)-N6)-threonylcarbamoyltransferase complex ATPase subunit type 1 TsaE [Tautonia marina]|uniref:tRNA (adenosine(37)-N6)-threonylcarbamoyltransferase complex ATPase subunit type 1 TsaE n=1 Tax=Tautonia marina TaxID=2653855 RepID=UPI001260AD96|nr:tRNA (adenosine(37)-N6)-threonylcarbamoyltransferase complex ATPase subunit type 1 TsaE [Tautonia marina]
MHIHLGASALMVELASETETEQVGRAIAGVIEPGTVIGLVGPLGAGKTRLCRAIAEGLGVDPGAIASPTFLLIHEYEGRLPVFHADSYRLDDPEEFDALGIVDEFEGPGVCLIEWADRIADRLPSTAWWVELEPSGVASRRLVIRSRPSILEQIAERLAPENPSRQDR